MGELAKQLSRGAAESKGPAAPSVAESLAEEELESELADAIESGDGKRIRAALRKLRDFEDA